MNFENILILIPTYNEAANIKLLLKGLNQQAKLLHPARLHVVFIDSNSIDGTTEVIVNSKFKYLMVTVLNEPRRGLGRAYATGLAYAHRQVGYDALATMDADLSHDPRYLAAMCNELVKGYDCVIGSRYIEGSTITQDWPVKRKLISKLANVLARRGLPHEYQTSDLTSGYRVYKMSTLKQLDVSNLKSRGYVFQVEFLRMLAKHGCRVCEYPIMFRDRRYGRSKLRLTDMREFLFFILLR